ncbi:hypothetical protein, partial [Dialister hominis]|uniref:hypothetical protein n=1 Tax=Dialister hominis TaxID=2582419 RepID=UPI003AB16512
IYISCSQTFFKGFRLNLIRGLFNTNTFVLSLEPHNRALLVGKVKHEKPYNRLAAWEMNLLSRLRRQLPLRGEL